MRLLHCTINNKDNDFSLDDSIDEAMLEEYIIESLRTNFGARDFYITEKKIEFVGGKLQVKDVNEIDEVDKEVWDNWVKENLT